MSRPKAYAKSLSVFWWKCVCSFYIIASSRSLLKYEYWNSEGEGTERKKNNLQMVSLIARKPWSVREGLRYPVQQSVIWCPEESRHMCCLLVKSPFLIFPRTFWIHWSNHEYVIQELKLQRSEVPTSFVKTGRRVEETNPLDLPLERWFIGLTRQDPRQDSKL